MPRFRTLPLPHMMMQGSGVTPIGGRAPRRKRARKPAMPSGGLLRMRARKPTMARGGLLLGSALPRCARRQPSAWQNFVKAVYNAGGGERSFVNSVKIASQDWRQMSPEQKAQYA